VTGFFGLLVSLAASLAYGYASGSENVNRQNLVLLKLEQLYSYIRTFYVSLGQAFFLFRYKAF